MYLAKKSPSPDSVLRTIKPSSFSAVRVRVRRRRERGSDEQCRSPDPSASIDANTLVYLQARPPLSDHPRRALRIAHLNSVLTLHKGTIHIVDRDVHGEFKNYDISQTMPPAASGPWSKVSSAPSLMSRRASTLNLIYYPRETFAHLEGSLTTDKARHDFVRRIIGLEFPRPARACPPPALRRSDLFPADYRQLFHGSCSNRSLPAARRSVDSLLQPFLRPGEDVELLPRQRSAHHQPVHLRADCRRRSRRPRSRGLIRCWRI